MVDVSPVNTSTIYELSPQRILARAISEVLRSHGVNVREKELEYIVNETPNPSLGDYGIPIMRYVSKLPDPEKILEQIRNRIREVHGDIVVDVIRVGGYLNIKMNEVNMARYLFTAIRSEKDGYGHVKADKPSRVVVEHTSANPVHPLHIGHARNAVLGDTLARLLKARGHIIQTRFYINDLGRQVAVLVYGLLKLGQTQPPPGIKIDHWYGYVYAVTHTLIDLSEIKKRIKEARTQEEYRDLVKEQDKLVAVLARLRERNPTVFDRLAEAISSDDEPESEIRRIMKDYEYKNNGELVEFIRRVVESCLEGFRETLGKLDIVFDKWDWESDLSWESSVRRIVEQAKESRYAITYRGALALDLNKLLDEKPWLRQALDIKGEIPPLILLRSDGTTLYTTRDIAYSLKKFHEFKADRVINVIASEQRLEQLQVRLSLIALGYEREGMNLLHYAYEMVNLPGRSMAGRRAEYVTLDELIDNAIVRAREEVEKRSQVRGEDERKRVAEAVGKSAIRYSLLSTAALKPLIFDINTALDFEKNSAPYIQYTYARAHNILAKHSGGVEWDNIDYTEASRGEKRRIIMLLWQYPYVFAKAADELRPEILVSYVNKLADVFNKWYQADPVLHEPIQAKKNFKLAMTLGVKIVVGNIMDLLGLIRLERM